SVAANAFSDGAANGNAASATFSWSYNSQPSVSFASASSSAVEASSSASVALTLSHSYFQPVSVSYALSGTATGGGLDFTHTGNSVTIPAGSTSASITISPIVDDSLAEGDETLILTLSSPVNASFGATTSHTYTITDNDGTPSFSIADATTPDENAAAQTLTVSLSPASSATVTVDYALGGGTATSGTDFTFTSGTLSFAAGDTSKTISVSVLADSDVEGDETVIISLSNPTGGATISDNSGTLTITDDDTAPTIDPNQAIVDDAILDTQTIIAKHVSSQGKSLLHASQNLIQTSIDHLIVRTQLQAKRRKSGGTSTQTASRAPSAGSPTSGNQSSANQSSVGQSSGGAASGSPQPAPVPSASFTEQASLAHRLADAVKLLRVDTDDKGYTGALDFDLYEPLLGQNSALITKITAAFSDQDNGPETSNLLASFALETESSDGDSVYGRFLHLSQTKADFRFSQSGTQDSKGISAGVYTVYSPKVDHLVTAFISFGTAQTDLDLTVSSAAVKDSFTSLNAQAGVSLARTIHRPGMMMVWEMAAESLVSRQQSRYASVLVGGSSYRAQISSRTVTDTSAIFTPKFIFDLQDAEDKQPSNLQLAPSVRCGSGTGSSSCGYGVSASLSQMMADNEGHTSFGLSVDRYRNTDTISYFIDINRSLLGHKGIRFDTHLKQLVTGGGSGGRPEYAINSVVRLPL
ncbi:Calx-beta domain-containing protein, partial [SAR116 cluster alpha proteobacterium HIMB100]